LTKVVSEKVIMSLLSSLFTILPMSFVHERQQSRRVARIRWRENVTIRR
jgi:hypothetical protein